MNLQIKSRKDFPALLTSLNLLDEVAEIGVGQGDFSYHILNNWNGEKLYSIDSWSHDNCWFDKSNASQQEQDKNYRITKEKLRKFGLRSEILRMLLIDARNDCITYDQLDFAYLDARHDYRSTILDIDLWYSAVKIGGILAGHDYKNSFVRKNLVEVKRAVDNFFFLKEKVWVTTNDNLPSWYVIKEKENQETI